MVTEEEKTEPERPKVLEEILATVQSIDKTVEEIKEQLADHLDEVRYQDEWYGRRPDYTNDNDYIAD